MDKIYIINPVDKPIKIVYENELLCPIALHLKINYRCKNAISKTDDLNYTIFCSDFDSCLRFKFE